MRSSTIVGLGLGDIQIQAHRQGGTCHVMVKGYCYVTIIAGPEDSAEHTFKLTKKAKFEQECHAPLNISLMRVLTLTVLVVGHSKET